MRELTVLRLFVSQRETFSKPMYYVGINKYDEGAVAQISAAFAIVYHVTC